MEETLMWTYYFPKASFAVPLDEWWGNFVSIQFAVENRKRLLKEQTGWRIL